MALTVALLAAACADGDPLVEDEDAGQRDASSSDAAAGDDDAGIGDAAVSDVGARDAEAGDDDAGSTDAGADAAVRPSDASVPGTNEPADFVPLTERPFSSMIEDEWTLSGAMPIVSDSDAPMSPSSVGRMTYAAGSSGGGAPASTNRYFSAGKTHLYIRYAFKLSSNWQGHSSGINKILFFHDLVAGSLYEQFITLAYGSGDDALNYRINAHGAYGANLAPATVVRGRWHIVEHIVVQSSGGGAADGELHVWFDGVKTHEHFDVIYDGLDNPPRHFRNVRWNPTWGGTGDTVGEEMHMWIDHIYVSGR